MFFSWKDFSLHIFAYAGKKSLKFSAMFLGSDIVLPSIEIDDGELFYCFSVSI